MPSKGINFGAPKSRGSVLSQNICMAASHQWEEGLEGLTLALQRIDKAASADKSRKKNQLRQSSEYKDLTAAAQAERERLLCQEIDARRMEKKEMAKQHWKELHGDWDEGRDKMEVDHKGEEQPEEEEDVEIEDESGDENLEVSSDEELEPEDAEEAAEGSENDEGPELSPERKVMALQSLGELLAKQREENKRMLDSLQGLADSIYGKETPDDYTF